MRLLTALVVTATALVAVAAGCTGADPDVTVGDSDAGTPAVDSGPTNPSTGVKALGDLCSGGGECASGFCADGVCCDKACNGQCEACTGAMKGTCAPVTGTPIAPRAACTGAGGSCAGTCDGTTSSTCTYVPAGVICGGSCTGTCDGSGTCSGGSGTCPNGFACGAAKCNTTCAGNTDCQPNFACDLGTSTCKRKPESDCLDGQDNNGDGLADCQDPSCVGTAVACVPAVGAGATIGTVVASAPCPAGFGAPQSIYQSINAGTCSGCSCKTKCDATITYFAGANCTNGSSDQEQYFGGTNGVATTCKNNVDFSAASGQVTSITRNGCTGSGTPAWTASSPAWQTSAVFCGVSRSSSTCGTNQLCVTKPASPLSASVASPGACPTGYVGTQATYYTTYTNGSCPACSACTPSTTVSCAIIGYGHRIAGDDTCADVSDFFSGTNCVNFGATDTIYSTHAMWEIGIASPDTCAPNTTPVAPTPTGGQLVCNVQ